MSDINVSVNSTPISVVATVVNHPINAATNGTVNINAANVSQNTIIQNAGIQGPPGNSMAISGDYATTIQLGDVSGVLQTQINSINLSGGNTFTGNVLKYYVDITSGVDTEFINYPTVLSYRPIINLDFENDVDQYIYAHSISGVNLNGFYINYSDNIHQQGYKLHVTLTL